MKYRVTINLAFDKESDAKALMDYAKTLTSKAVSINEDKDNAEISFCDYHKCYHDEIANRPCEPIEKVEIRKIQAVPIER
jgi:hypothetical protein